MRKRGNVPNSPVESCTEEEAAIVRTALDYLEGWFDGDAPRVECFPAIANRSVASPRGNGFQRSGKPLSPSQVAQRFSRPIGPVRHQERQSEYAVRPGSLRLYPTCRFPSFLRQSRTQCGPTLPRPVATDLPLSRPSRRFDSRRGHQPSDLRKHTNVVYEG